MIFRKNRAGQSGGGLFLRDGESSLADVTFSENEAGASGGGVHLDMGDHRLVDVSMIGNKAMSSGGGLALRNTTSTSLEKVKISNNQSFVGGGLWVGYVRGTNAIKLESVTISNNRATASGGGIFAGGKLQFNKNVAVWGNLADAGGGLATDGELICINNKPNTNSICGNTATTNPNCSGTSGSCPCDTAPCRTDTCGDAKPCPAGFTCIKSDGEKRCECASGQICGSACCAPGQKCNDRGVCVTPAPPCGAKGERCGQDTGRACCDGLTCAGMAGVDSTCLVPAGGPCQTNADCTFGTDCILGECLQRLPLPCRSSVRSGDNAGLKDAIEKGGIVTLGEGAWTLNVTATETFPRPGAEVSKATTIVACPNTRPRLNCTAFQDGEGNCLEVRATGSLGLEGIAIAGTAQSAPGSGVSLEQGGKLAMSASSVSGFAGYGIYSDGGTVTCSAGTGNTVCNNVDINCGDPGVGFVNFPGCGCCDGGS